MLRSTTEITATDEAPSFGEREADALAAAALRSIRDTHQDFETMSMEVAERMRRLWNMTGFKADLDADLITIVTLGRLEYLDAHEADRYAKAHARVAGALDMRP